MTDDSGILALLDPAAYETFVDTEWTFEQIMAHFTTQFARRSLLIWGTGSEGFWKVDVRLEKSNVRGFRETKGPLKVAGGALLVTNYESLTMAAQFKHVVLPQKHERDQLVSLPDGEYICRIIQMFDPEQEDAASTFDFVVEILPATKGCDAWERIPWFRSDG